MCIELIWVFNTLARTLYISNTPFIREVPNKVELPYLNGFEGFSKPVVEALPKSVKIYQRLAFNVRQLMNDVGIILQKNEPEIRIFPAERRSPWGTVSWKYLTISLWADYNFSRYDWYSYPDVIVQFDFEDVLLVVSLIIDAVLIVDTSYIQKEDLDNLIHSFQERDYNLIYTIEGEELDNINLSDFLQ